MAFSSGAYTTQVNPELRSRSVYLRDKLNKQGNYNPFHTYLKNKGKVIKETHTKFEFVTLSSPLFKFQVENVNDSDTSITVKTSESEVKSLGSGDIIRNIVTGEQMRVVSVAGKVLTVTRKYGDGNKAVAITGDANNTFIRLNREFEEGSKAPNGTIIERISNYNYTQTFRETLKVSRKKLKEGGYGDNGKTAEQRRGLERERVLRKHQNEIEMGLLFGVRNKSIQNGEESYVTGGITSFITTNTEVYTDSSKFTVNSINDMLGKISDSMFGAGGEKLLMYGSGFDKKLNDNIIQVFGGGGGTVITEYGLSINKVKTNYGIVNFLYNPVFSAVYPNSAVILSIDDLILHEIEETRLDMNIQSDGYDGVIDTYLTDCGLEVANEMAHGIIHLNF